MNEESKIPCRGCGELFHPEELTLDKYCSAKCELKDSKRRLK